MMNNEELAVVKAIAEADKTELFNLEEDMNDVIKWFSGQGHHLALTYLLDYDINNGRLNELKYRNAVVAYDRLKRNGEL
ncbi:hypothetical protein [Peribacillus frigoritolerans]|uniref:hypothetical protein n=1 Tax=Peribacillus frigoritolerans TaxID=450367 RepID=UPI0010714F4E|nr:hypothetical protein [Peribacillus frigoritolerans]TFH63491.1 hypothetical protein E4J71_07010 [Peribacillus frigoritolerans]